MSNMPAPSNRTCATRRVGVLLAHLALFVTVLVLALVGAVAGFALVRSRDFVVAPDSEAPAAEPAAA